MGAALGLATMLLVVVAVLRMAVSAQSGPFQPSATRRSATTAPPVVPPETVERQPGTAQAERPGSSRLPGADRSQIYKPTRRPAREKPPETAVPEAGLSPDKAITAEPEPATSFAADAKPLDAHASARVMSVVDERQLGPVTKSRLTLLVQPVGSEAFEVVARVAFASPQEREGVKVGSTVPVRYDSEDHRRVVVEMGKEKP